MTTSTLRGGIMSCMGDNFPKKRHIYCVMFSCLHFTANEFFYKLYETINRAISRILCREIQLPARILLISARTSVKIITTSKAVGGSRNSSPQKILQPLPCPESYP